MADAFLVCIDSTGRLQFYLMEDNSIVAEFRSQNPIIKVFPNPHGTKCVCVDSTGNGFMYNPVLDQAIMIPNFQGGTNNVLWDIDNPNLFVTVDGEKMCSYIYVPLSLEGI